MHKVKQKLKLCKHSFIQWRKKQKGNARDEIEMIKNEVETMQKDGGTKRLGEMVVRNLG